METNDKIRVVSATVGEISAKEGTTGVIRRWKNEGSEMMLTKDDIMRIAQTDGGRDILENALIVYDDELMRDLSFDLEPEYKYTRKEVKKIFTEGTVEDLEDVLEYAGWGLKAIIKDEAIKSEIPDINKRRVISENLGISIDKIIANNEGAEEVQEEVATPRRRTRTNFLEK